MAVRALTAHCLASGCHRKSGKAKNLGAPPEVIKQTKEQGQTRCKPDSVQVRTSGIALAYVFIAAWVVLVGSSVWTQRLPLWTLALLIAVNMVTYGIYAADKRAAKEGRWRAAESTLHLLSLSGGWPAAWLAQKILRHKSNKAEFPAVYWLSVALNCGAVAWLVIGNTRLSALF